MSEFNALMFAAQQIRNSARATLSTIVGRVGMAPINSWEGSQHQALATSIENFVKAEARVAVLETLQDKDFFLAMSQSAAAMEQV